jgi:hypothetical protein
MFTFIKEEFLGAMEPWDPMQMKAVNLFANVDYTDVAH